MKFLFNQSQSCLPKINLSRKDLIQSLAATLGLLALVGPARSQMQTPSWMQPKQPATSGCARPAYPADALRVQATGTVTMLFLVSLDGTVRDAKLKKSSGKASLDTTAINALSNCKFKPAQVDGQPVEQWQEVKYVWAID